ncbi:DegT/DnrJ/EryC1/StrS family aminotransferase [Dactylosporangium sp. NPDC050688]|uniref:DegT/DnrJ/EryC1/StrS family aminotransferase n=1 Tax=Dactylosporangium sp. NPDC050688 TaxID=3157217 RepID=UPI0033F8EDDF
MSTGHDLALLGGTPVAGAAPAWTWPPIDQDDARVLGEMALRGELSYYGREGCVRDLEDRFAEYIGVPHALATTSGTTALHSAYFGLGLGPGDEVLAPTYTFLATVMPLFVVNTVPVLVDADPHTGNIDPADIERHITARTRAIVVTHVWGNPVDMPAVMDIADRHGLRVIEDCSHAHGAKCAGRKVGSFGDVAVFSLQGKKLVAAGQGGLMLTRHREVFERAVLLGHFKVRAEQQVHSPAYRPYVETGFGLNYRMHPLAGAIALRQFDRLEEYIAGRRHNFDYLTAELADLPGVRPPAAGAHVDRQVYYSYKPRYRPEELDGLPVDVFVAALRAEGVPVERYRAVPLHQERIFQDPSPPLLSHGDPQRFAGGADRRVYRTGDLPQSEAYAADLLSLPAYTEPDRALMDRFAAGFRKVSRQYRALHEYSAVSAER